MYAVSFEENNTGTVCADGGVLYRFVKSGEVFPIAVTHYVGLPVRLVRHIIEVTLDIGHGPYILSSIICKYFKLLGFGIPAFYVGVVVTFVSLTGGKTIAFGRFVKVELSCDRVLHQVGNGIEIVWE
ncbi:hypothetical protein SDC9_73554 [bioreactor metagenome]|uniref:Uncharacterized protein n=1 Tax=bioreactor metagenome TaxID=1076179 RepID=A0A644YFD1_9ZZZZ